MKVDFQDSAPVQSLSFYGGVLGTLLPFLLFIVGVVSVALSGAPDERGFWPILIGALGIGLLLAKDKQAYSETVIAGMSQQIVMIMITAWMLASIIGVLMSDTGFVTSLIWLANQVSLTGVGMTVAAFIICSVVSLSTGSSFATILICSPLLYPAGGLLGADLPTLAGAIIGGATFGDFIAPISDTTIASALSQKAKIGPTVRSRVKYILPVMLLAIVGYYVSAVYSEGVAEAVTNNLEGSPEGLPMILIPILIIALFLKGKHLLHGLLLGLIAGVILALILGLLPMDQLFSLDLEKMSAQSFIIDGINRAVGLSFFTILLMGIVETLKASGLVANLVNFASSRTNTTGQGETWITGSAAAAVLLTTHSIVAILMVSEFANKIGEKVKIYPIRRANILSLVACIFPFLLPYFIPVILMANTTNTGDSFGVSAVSPVDVGLHNFVAWGLLIVLAATLLFGYGREKDATLE